MAKGVQAAASAKRAAVPDRLARLVAQPKGRQRAAIKQVDAQPVPAHRATLQQLLAPLMVQPGGAAAAQLQGLALQRQAAADLQLRQAVVVAGLAGVGALARQALVALQQQGLRAGKAQVHGKVFCADGRVQVGILAQQRPVLQHHAGIQTAGRGVVGSVLPRRLARPAGNALVMPEALAHHIGEGGMGKQQLARGQARTHGLRALDPAAKKGDLETVGCLLPGHVGPAGEVPPLGLEVGVRTGIAWKHQCAGQVVGLCQCGTQAAGRR